MESATGPSALGAGAGAGVGPDGPGAKAYGLGGEATGEVVGDVVGGETGVKQRAGGSAVGVTTGEGDSTGGRNVIGAGAGA
ncbi:putative protein [Arabidopsis thaliana]|uniref:Uncharacterized protein AT4g40090 n=1 Tax=Arabidopsis thaliana TaxID=3702 RepID=Q9M064_ARATH|nr:putative protein [Arabidopsis thaliana]